MDTPEPLRRAIRRSFERFDGTKAHLRYAARSLYLFARREVTAPIERRRGIETARPVALREVGLDHPERGPYEPSSWVNLVRALRRIDTRPDDVFLDLGCGKGRVLLAAARMPFHRVVGVEIAPQLCDVARANLESDLRHRRCGSVEVVAADATTWPVPDDVTVVFMYNPMQGEAFGAALDRLVESLERNPRRIWLIYSVPLEEQRVLATGRAQFRFAIRGLRPGRAWSRKMSVHVYELR